jgi:hypothetical protein
VCIGCALGLIVIRVLSLNARRAAFMIVITSLLAAALSISRMSVRCESMTTQFIENAT